MTSPAAILLAAGEGRRMGGPKALLVVDGKPLVYAHVERLAEAGCRPIVVVVRSSVVEEVRAIVGGVSEARVVGTDSESMAASLSVGLARLSLHTDQAVIVTPVDTLPAARSTLEALLTGVRTAGVQVTTPCHRTRGGHPIVARQSLLQAFRNSYSGTLRDLLRSAEAQRLRLEVDDAAVVSDLDTPADLAALRPSLLPHFANKELLTTSAR